jgi:hypothetical protein
MHEYEGALQKCKTMLTDLIYSRLDVAVILLRSYILYIYHLASYLARSQFDVKFINFEIVKSVEILET